MNQVRATLGSTHWYLVLRLAQQYKQNHHILPCLSAFELVHGNRVIFGKSQYNHLTLPAPPLQPPFTFPFRKSGPCPPVLTQFQAAPQGPSPQLSLPGILSLTLPSSLSCFPGILEWIHKYKPQRTCVSSQPTFPNMGQERKPNLESLISACLCQCPSPWLPDLSMLHLCPHTQQDPGH